MSNRFDFRLEAVLKYRRFQREHCRGLLAGVLADLAALNAHDEELATQQDEQREEIREIGAALGRIDVRAMASRRYYATQLQLERRENSHRRQMIEEQLRQCRHALVEADRRVKSLEKMRQQAWETFQREAEKKTEREREEVWAAAQALEQTS